MRSEDLELPEGVHLLDLPQKRAGFLRFISSWFFVDALGRRIVLDPGPASTVPLLLDRLSRIADDVDLVLLTHIHLDHSGGVAQFCTAYPNAKVLVHPKGVKHLIDPGKLWKASLETLGDVAETYGEPLPLPADRLMQLEELQGIAILETPGHAPHHLSFSVPVKDATLFFVGEAAGLYLPMPAAERPYLRPTTPPRFDGAAARASLEKIGQALQGDELLCYSHWGAARNPRQMIAFARRQLDEWFDFIGRMRRRPDEEIVDRLLADDPLLSAWSRLPQELQERERIFIKNSVRGFLGYLEEQER